MRRFVVVFMFAFFSVACYCFLDKGRETHEMEWSLCASCQVLQCQLNLK